MMPPLIVLEIINNALLLALEIVKHMPPEQHMAFWAQHQKDVEWWRALYTKLAAA